MHSIFEGQFYVLLCFSNDTLLRLNHVSSMSRHAYSIPSNILGIKVIIPKVTHLTTGLISVL